MANIQAFKDRIIAVSTHKGGVGKTTISEMLASGLANEGYNVAWVDLDAQGQAALWHNLPQSPGLYNVLVKEQTMASQLIEVPPESWRYKRNAGRFYILPANETNSIIWEMFDDALLTRDKTIELLESGIVDYVIFDTPPSISVDAINFMLAAGRLVIPVKPSFLAYTGVESTLSAITRLEEQTQDLPEEDRVNIDVIGIVPNLVNTVRGVHRMNLENIRERFGPVVWPIMNDYTAFEEASQSRESIWVYQPKLREANNARARARAVFAALMAIIKEDEVDKVVAHG